MTRRTLHPGAAVRRPRRLLLTCGLTSLSLVVACGGYQATAPTSSIVPTSPAVSVSPHPTATHTPPTVSVSPHPTATRTPPSTWPGCPRPQSEPITRASGSGKTVALTFDDGASPYTPQILAVLKRYGVKATFFDTGIADARYPAYARAEVADGNVLGNHTFDHPMNWGYRSYVPYAVQRSELIRATTILTKVAGHPPCFMRPPGGAYDSASLALVRSQGMSLVMWSVSGNDWQQPPFLSTAFQNHILSLAEAGARQSHPVILLHAGKSSHEPECNPGGCLPGQVSSFRGNTVAVLPALIDFYRARGFTFVVF